MNPKDDRSPVRKVLTRVVELSNKLPGAGRIITAFYEIGSNRIPKAYDRYRIVHISDLHGRWFGKEQEELTSAVCALEPNIILMTGDWVDYDFEGDDRLCTLAMVQALQKIAPLYGIIGNHEARAYHRTAMIEELREKGVKLLVDQRVTLEREGQKLAIVGLSTAYHTPLYKHEGDYDKWRQCYGNVLLPPQAEIYQVVMAHRPELINLYAELGADLVLAGHAHGGLMKLPRGRRLLAPGQGFLPKFTHGIYHKGRTQMIVSCGLGGPRIGIKPEIGLITLEAR